MTKREIVEQLELIVCEYDVTFGTFINYVSDYFSSDDLQGLLDHVAKELDIV